MTSYPLYVINLIYITTYAQFSFFPSKIENINSKKSNDFNIYFNLCW